MSARRRSSRKPRRSEAEREARRAADTALTEAAAARLSDDDAAADLVAFTLARPGLARLSLHNVALLMEQCDARGTDVTEVRTFGGWQAVGRTVVKGAKAYKLTVPRRDREQAKTADQADESPAEETKPKRPRFYLKAGWFDVADTQPAAADGEAADQWREADPAAGPAEVYASLVAQAERAGYAIEEAPADGHGVGTQLDEDDPATIHVRVPATDADDTETRQVLADLAQILTEETRASDETDATRPKTL